MPSYNSTLDYLFALRNSGIKLGLERIEALMALMDSPYSAYPTVIVAGTNGKGSVSAIVASILSEAGYRVGLYTSPHLVKFNERIRVDGEVISDAEIVKLTEEIRALVEGADSEGEGAGLAPELFPTFFEFTTALAFAYFKDKGVDIAILEVGMGGRLDATNVVNPILSVITSIGLDHVSSLGDDIALIAGEKGGVIKDGSTVICGELTSDARSVIERISTERGAKLVMAGEEFKVESAADNSFTYTDSVRKLKGLKLALRGAHQQLNAGVAIAALGPLSRAGFKTTSQDITKGLALVKWPGRCELVMDSPKVVLDCAHNESAAKALGEALLGFSFSRLILVLGIMSDKDIDAIFTEFAPIADSIILTSPEIARAESPEKLLDRLSKLISRKALSVKPSVAASVDEALKAALDMASSDDLVCVTGSVFVVGEAKSFFEQL